MNFFKKVLGIFPSFEGEMKQANFTGTLFRVINNARNIIYKNSQITFGVKDGDYYIAFTGLDEERQTYRFPIHKHMNLVNFAINKNGQSFAGFEWQLEDESEHVGCYLTSDKKDNFKELFCKVIHKVKDDENIKEPLDLCRELGGIPSYKGRDNEFASKVNNLQQMNKVLLEEAQKKENKMAHTCSYTLIQNDKRNLVSPSAVFVLTSLPGNKFEFGLINMTGFKFVRKPFTSDLTHQISVEQSYIRWLDLEDGYKIVEIGFGGKKDAAMSLRYNLMECLFQMNTGKKIQDEIPAQQVAYLKKMNDVPNNMESKIVKIYEKEKEDVNAIVSPAFIYDNPEAHKGLEKYKAFCQAKINNFSIAALGSMLETLQISEENQIKLIDKRRLFGKGNVEVDVSELLLHDNDSKGFVRSDNGKLYYQDLVKGRLIQEWEPSKKGVQRICPEFKQADATNFKTFKVISENSIYEFDPRTANGIGSMKSYSTNPVFTAVSVDQQGRFAIGAKNGQIRLYDKNIGANACNKFSSMGDAVLHLDSTKDGKWLLATFARYLRLLPTETEDDKSLYESRIPFVSRPDPITLQIKLEDMGKYKVDHFQFVPAKFDEGKGSLERYIVSGFGPYTVVWNVSQVMRGDVNHYLITRNDGELVEADFKYNDAKKLIMRTTKGIVIKETSKK